ncbi:MAG: hypothetical protein ABI171_00375, partial [Collimonas sp.]|uniref:hypothetical protein n=1 Tax=Collimonas sp. TaxID=1963772 RepID=UPI00326764B3
GRRRPMTLRIAACPSAKLTDSHMRPKPAHSGHLLRPQPTGLDSACGRLDFGAQLPLAVALGRDDLPAWK